MNEGNNANSNWECDVARIACHNIAKKIIDMDVSDIEIPRVLSERVAKLITEESAHLNARKRLLRKRIAIAVIAAIVVALTACMSIPAIREKLYEIVITYHDKYFTYKSEPDDTEDAETDTLTTGESRDTESITDDPLLSTDGSGTDFVTRRPSHIPEGYELYMDLSVELTTYLIYLNANDGSMITYEQNFIGAGIYDFDNEDVELTEILVNGYQGFSAIKLMEAVQEVSLLWNDGVYDYFINASLSLEETIKIAESIA